MSFTGMSDRHRRRQSLSSVTAVDEIRASIHRYMRYCHESGIIVLSIPGVIIWAYLHFVSPIFNEVGLFEHIIYSWAGLYSLHLQVGWRMENLLKKPTLAKHKCNLAHMMTLGRLNAMVPLLWQYLKYRLNKVNVPPTTLPFDNSYKFTWLGPCEADHVSTTSRKSYLLMDLFSHRLKKLRFYVIEDDVRNTYQNHNHATHQKVEIICSNYTLMLRRAPRK